MEERRMDSAILIFAGRGPTRAESVYMSMEYFH